MKTTTKTVILLLLAGAIAGAFVLKNRQAASSEENDAAPVADTLKAETSKSPDATVEDTAASGAEQTVAGIPKLVDVGAGKCIPCKMMAPILEELRKDYAGKMEVQFVDVWEHPEAGEPYGIQVIPTQIFYDAAGKELFRHTGYFAKEDILAKWTELGVEL
jgi:thioredoxin 1